MRLYLFLVVMLVGLWPAGRAAAEIATAWQESKFGRVRLVAGGSLAQGSLAAGLHIELADGWKTYWRAPGDAGGVPPAFDWSGSENVTARLLYPAPKRFEDKAGITIGYKGRVVFPIELAVADAKAAARLRLKVEYGVCREICVPAEAALSLEIPPQGAGEPADVVSAALKTVPRPAGAGVGPSLAQVRTQLAGAQPEIVFTVRYPGQAEHADAFAEVEGGAYLPAPRRLKAEGSEITYRIDVAGLDLADIKGHTVVLTLVSDGGASEAHIKPE